MKKLFYLTVVIFSLAACGEETNSEDNKTSEIFNDNDVEAKVLSVLRMLNEEPSSENLKYFMSLQEFRSLADSDDTFISTESRNRATNMSKKEFKQFSLQIIDQLRNIREEAKKYNINWEKIAFDDYTFIRQENDGFRSAKMGKLNFNYSGNLYSVDVNAIEVNGENYLYEIKRITALDDVVSNSEEDKIPIDRLDLSIYDSESVLFSSRSSGNYGNIEVMELITSTGTWYYHTAYGHAEGIKLGSRTVDGMDAVYFYKSPNTNYTMVFGECGYSLTNQKTGEEQWYEQISPECK